VLNLDLLLRKTTDKVTVHHNELLLVFISIRAISLLAWRLGTWASLG